MVLLSYKRQSCYVICVAWRAKTIRASYCVGVRVFFFFFFVLLLLLLLWFSFRYFLVAGVEVAHIVWPTRIHWSRRRGNTTMATPTTTTSTMRAPFHILMVKVKAGADV